VVIETPQSESFSADGSADLVIHYGFCLYAATKGMATALAQFRDGYSPRAVEKLLEDVNAFESRFEYGAFAERVRKYGI
jgi:hypothetical protein